MKSWFTSLNGAIVLSVVTLLSELWRGFLDAIFVLPVDLPNEALRNLAAVLFTLVFSLWAWSLLSASRGSRKGLIAAFIINALIWLLTPVGWLVFYCPAACRAEAGIFNLVNTLNLLFGLLSGVALGIQIFGSASSNNRDIVKVNS